MSNKFAVCPTCGAVSVAGEPCEYCGTPIVVKEDTATYKERIVPKRTIHPVAFAQKVSVFKAVGEYICNCSVVSMGGLKGLINLNGDFIFPLEYGEIKIYPCWIAYFQTGSNCFLFDLLLWRRLNYKIESCPDRVHREFFSEDGNDDEYSYQLLAVEQEYWERGRLYKKSSFRVYDKDDREVIYDSDYNFKVKGGIVFSDNQKYFDINTRKVFQCPRRLTQDVLPPTAYFWEKDGKLAIFLFEAGISETFVLDIEGKSAEGIQKEIDRVIEEIMRRIRSRGSGGSGGSGGCYVATAVYGSYDCPEVWTLRRYRDNMLNKTWHGRAFIKCYYAISPTLVRWFGQSSWFRRMWKAPLDRIVMNLQSKGVQNTPYDDLY